MMPTMKYKLHNYIWRILGIVLTCLFVACPFFIDVAAHSDMKVLFISSYSYDWPIVQNQIKGIKDALGNEYEINYIFMDSKNISKSDVEQLTYEKLQTMRQAGETYDAVILGDDDALDFARKYRQEFFATVPVVYEGINSYPNAMIANDEGMTGVIETLPLVQTIKIGRKVMPQATRVVAVVDGTSSGRGGLTQYLSEKENFPDLDFDYIVTSDYTAEELADLMASYHNDTILLELIFTDDRDGNRYTVSHGAAFLSHHARIPIMSATEIGMGYGYLGGTIIDTRKMAYQSALMLKSVLEEGRSPASIAPITLESTNVFDKKVIDKFNINRSVLPETAVLLNEEKGFFYQYRYITVPATILFLVVVLWLIREIYNNRKRQKMMTELSSNSAMMRIALKQSGLRLWEYFPERHMARIDRSDHENMGAPILIYNYPQAWIDAGHVHPDDTQAFTDMVQKSYEGAREATCEIRTRYQDGTWHWERLHMISIYDASGKRTNVIGSVEGIEDYKALEERFLICMKQSGMMAWVFDIHTSSIVLTKELKNFFGDAVPTTGIPESILAAGLVHDDDKKAFTHMYECIWQGNPQAEGTFRWLMGDTYRWFHFVYTVIFDSDGRPVKAFGIVLDVTEQKRSEERLQAELHRIETLEGNTRASSSFDLNTGKIYQWTYEGESYLTDDFSLEDGIAESGLHIPDEKERDYYISHLELPYLRNQYEQGQHHFTMDYRRRALNNKVIWVRTYVYLSKQYDSGQLMAYVYTRDIDHTMTEQLAVDSIINEEVEFIAIIDRASHKERVLKSRRHSVMVGTTYQYEYFIDRMIRGMVEEDRAQARTQYEFDHVLAKLEQEENCVAYYRMNDLEGTIRRKRTMIYYLDDTKQYLIYVRSDITELYEEEQRQKGQLEKALKKAEVASQAKSDFLSHMSHEIRTPMNAIIGLATLISEHAVDADYVAENIAKVNMSANFLLALINDILDISRIESGRMELNNTDVLFDGFIQMLNLTISEQALDNHVCYNAAIIGAPDKAYRFDEMKLKQVLLNVLSNAIKFTPTGGHVWFTVEKYGNEGTQDWLRFIIKDTGIGIAEDFLPKVFDAFAQEYSGNTTMYGGTGLGLAISKNIANLMGGDISVVSKKGVGTTFTVTLKLAKVSETVCQSLENVQATATRNDMNADDFRGKRVLLAEDNEINREIAVTILEQWGLLVDAVTNGQAAVQAFLDHQSDYYAAILMDVRMPVMDGLEATRQIRALHKERASTIPILAMTANAYEEDVRESLAAGMNAHLSKPIDPHLLFQRLREYIS